MVELSGKNVVVKHPEGWEVVDFREPKEGESVLLQKGPRVVKWAFCEYSDGQWFIMRKLPNETPATNSGQKGTCPPNAPNCRCETIEMDLRVDVTKTLKLIETLEKRVFDQIGAYDGYDAALKGFQEEFKRYARNQQSLNRRVSELEESVKRLRHLLPMFKAGMEYTPQPPPELPIMDVQTYRVSYPDGSTFEGAGTISINGDECVITPTTTFEQTKLPTTTTSETPKPQPETPAPFKAGDRLEVVDDNLSRIGINRGAVVQVDDMKWQAADGWFVWLTKGTCGNGPEGGWCPSHFKLANPPVDPKTLQQSKELWGLRLGADKSQKQKRDFIPGQWVVRVTPYPGVSEMDVGDVVEINKVVSGGRCITIWGFGEATFDAKQFKAYGDGFPYCIGAVECNNTGKLVAWTPEQIKAANDRMCRLQKPEMMFMRGRVVGVTQATIHAVRIHADREEIKFIDDAHEWRIAADYQKLVNATAGLYPKL